MIDDDFDKIVRHMFEHFFDGPMVEGPNGSDSFGIRIMSRGSHPDSKMEYEQFPRVERIEFDDKILMILDRVDGDDGPTVRASGNRIYVEFPTEKVKPLEFVLPFSVDLEESSVSYRNGITEINLIKAKREETSSEKKEGILRFE